MKNYWNIIATAGLAIACCLPVQAGIKGTILNSSVGDSVALHDPFARQAPALEKVAVNKKGAFEFAYSPSDISFFYLILSNGKNVLIVLKPDHNGQIEIDAVTGLITKVTDSEQNTLLKSMQEILTKYADQHAIIDQAADKTTEQKQREKLLIEQQKMQEIQNTALQNTANYASAALIEYLPVDDFLTVHDSVLTTLLKKYPENFVVKEKYKDMESKKKLAVGYPAPEIVMEDTAGNLVSLSSLRGKLVLIDFWASWCRPCRVENPNVVRLYQTYKQYGFDILGVSLDNNREYWMRAIHADGLIWNHVSDLKGWQSAAVALYGFNGIPFTILVDKNGYIIAKGLRGAALEQKVKSVLLQQ
jgi:peroxiredoxin